MISNKKKQKRILIASLLKPVKDVRMYEKFGLSCLQHTDFDIHILGFNSNSDTVHSKIKFHTLFDFRRLSFQRWLAPIKYYLKLLQLKVDLIIFNSPDFQLFTVFYQIIFGKNTFYDIRENYLYNFFYLSNFSWILRGVFGCGYRMKEFVTSRKMRGFILAERSYKNQLSFVAKRDILLENKLVVNLHPFELKNKTRFDFIFSGTISRIYGLNKVLKWALDEYKYNQEFNLRIVGFCPVEADFEYLSVLASEYPFLSLFVSKKPVLHSDIIEKLLMSEAGLVLYEDNKAIAGCIPTKLYEYMGLQLGVILDNNTFWKELVKYYTPTGFKDKDVGLFNWFSKDEFRLIDLVISN